MRLSAFVAATALMAACSQTPPKSAETMAVEAESPRIAAASAVEPATADAVCKRGSMNSERSFIICEDGKLRKAGVLMALSAPHDPDLNIESVAGRYGIPTQVFTGIESATYATLINTERKSVPKRGKHEAREGLVQIEGKIYDVYQVSTGKKSGTIFVERKAAIE